MATPTYSERRVACADYRGIHRKKIYFNNRFKSVSAVGLEDVKNVFSKHTTAEVEETDWLCGNCLIYFSTCVKSSQLEHRQGSSSSNSEDPTYREHVDYVDTLNQSIATSSLDVSPFKPRVEVTSRSSYARRKADQLETEFSRKSRRLVSLAYDEAIPESSRLTDQHLEQWEANIRTAFLKAETIRERCRILTLVPSSYSTARIQEIIPEATKYLILKAKRLQLDTEFGHHQNHTKRAMRLAPTTLITPWSTTRTMSWIAVYRVQDRVMS